MSFFKEMFLNENNKREERTIYEKNRKEMLIDDTKTHYYEEDKNFLCHNHVLKLGPYITVYLRVNS